MDFKLSGTIDKIAEVIKGESQAGKAWQKVTFSIKNNEGYEGQEQVFAFEIFGEDKVEKFIQYNKVGKAVDVSFNIRTNEYKEKFYTTLQAWKVFGSDAGAEQTKEQMETVEDDLPF